MVKFSNTLFLLFLLGSFLSRAQPLKLRRATDICNPDSVVLGRFCPNFYGTSLAGLKIPVSSFKGSYVIIMVWSTSTQSSLKEYPFFTRLKEKFSAPGIQFLDIAVDKDKQDWEFFYKQHPEPGVHWFADPLKPPFSYFLLKRKDRGEHTYFSYTVPQFILLNPEGRIIENKTSFFPSDTTRFNTLVRSLPVKKG